MPNLAIGRYRPYLELCADVRVTIDVDRVFKALADSTRRTLLDSLRRDNGQTLGRLCGQLDMARQSAAQHLAVLEEANLISTVRRGREKLALPQPCPDPRHPATVDRAIRSAPSTDTRRRQATRRGTGHDYRQARLRVRHLHPKHPAAVWHTLTDADLTAEYWGHSNVSDWQVGSQWEHRRIDGSNIAATIPPSGTPSDLRPLSGR